MNNYFNPEGSYDNESEDAGELLWGEFEWQQYLRLNRRHIHRFLDLYKNSYLDPNCFEIIAKEFEWDLFDSNSTEDSLNSDDDSDSDDDEDPIEEFDGAIYSESEEDIPQDTFTIHKHPTFIITSGLALFIKELVESLLTSHPDLLSPILSWNLASSLKDAQLDAFLGINAYDLGHEPLAIIHLKLALQHLNSIFSTLQTASSNKRSIKPALNLLKTINHVTFDFREVLLRLISECRISSQQQDPTP